MESRLTDEQILRFEVSVEDTVAMAVPQTGEELVGKFLNEFTSG